MYPKQLRYDIKTHDVYEDDGTGVNTNMDVHLYVHKDVVVRALRAASDLTYEIGYLDDNQLTELVNNQIRHQ